MPNLLQIPELTERRIWLAFAVALVADGIPIFFGPLAWGMVDEVIDVAAMILETALLGFHPLFLPTFIAELLPGIDLFPTWTGCVALVIALRKKRQSSAPPSRVPPGDVIDV